MANNYLQFSEVVSDLTRDEENWLRDQLATVYVFGEREYEEGRVPKKLDSREADWVGCRAYRDVPECAEYVKEMDIEGPDFQYEFHDDRGKDGRGAPKRYLWVYTEESGYVDGVAHLVRKFLKKFRPWACWSLTYACTCSKLRVGEFSGGAVFVTADQVRGQDSCDFVAEQRAAFTAKHKTTTR